MKVLSLATFGLALQSGLAKITHAQNSEPRVVIDNDGTKYEGKFVKGAGENKWIMADGTYKSESDDFVKSGEVKNSEKTFEKITYKQHPIADSVTRYFKNGGVENYVIQFKDGGHFIGEMNDQLNFKEGIHVLDSTGSAYRKGKFENDELVEGEYRSPSGAFLKGTFKDGAIAEGIVISKDGKTVSDGTYVNGLLDGDNCEVTIYEPEGKQSTMQGTFRKNKMVKGEFVKSNGDTLIGQFENDRLVEGTRIMASGERQTVSREPHPDL